MISVICVYNDKKMFSECLLKSLRQQTVPYELIAVDNTASRFSSAAGALNYGASKIKAETSYVMFVHQDIDFATDTLLEEAEKLLEALPNLGIAGAAGRRRKDEPILSNITHGALSNRAGQLIDHPMEVMTVDECLVIIAKEVFEQQSFDEKTCDGWHAYAVDYSLSIKKTSRGVFVIPLSVHHGSEGPLDTAYFKALKKILKKHKKDYNEICATCGCWNTHVPVVLQMIRSLGLKRIDSLYRSMICLGMVPKRIIQKRLKQKNNTK